MTQQSDECSKPAQDESGSESMSWGDLLCQAGVLYREVGLSFTWALVPAVAQLLVGIYIAMMGSLWFETWMASAAQVDYAMTHPSLVVIAILLIGGGGLFLFFRGSWQYLVHWVSLCRNVQEFVDGETPDFRAAYADWFGPDAGQNKVLLAEWLVLWCCLPALPLLPLVGLPLLGALLAVPPGVSIALMIVGFLAGGLFGLVWLGLQFLLTYGFQVVALEGQGESLWPLLWRSGRLAVRHPWLTLLFQVVLFVSTNFVLVVPVVKLLRVIRVLAPLDAVHQWLAGVLAGNASELLQNAGVLQQVTTPLKLLHVDLLTVGPSITDSVVGLTITLLLLPLGTLVFTLTYLEMCRAEQSV